MSVLIPAMAARGDIVRAYIPHHNEVEVWPRNLLILGFVFRAGSTEPDALMTARFSFNTEHLYSEDLQFGPEYFARNDERVLTLRANRVDVIPLRQFIFTEQLRIHGHVESADFWMQAMPALERGLAAGDAQDTMFMRLRESDEIHTGPERNSPRAVIPDALRNHVLADDYALALESVKRQDGDLRRELHENYMRNFKRPGFAEDIRTEFPAPVMPAPVLPEAVPVAAAIVPIPEPWWKTNPQLLEERKAAAAESEVLKKTKHAPASDHEAADLSQLTQLFGVEVGRKTKSEAQPQREVQEKKPKPEKKISPPVKSREDTAPSKDLTQAFMKRPTLSSLQFPGSAVPVHFFERGLALKIKPLGEASPFVKHNVGLVWNVYRDRNTGQAAGVEMIPCRRGDGAGQRVDICDPLSHGQKSGFTAATGERFIIPLTEEFVVENQSQDRPINAVFVRQIGEAILKQETATLVFGLNEIPGHWEKIELETPRITREDLAKYALLQKTETVTPRPA